jgi:hypothetical protein
MPTAPHTPALASHPRQGVGARFVRRLGGAVRRAIAGGITLAGSLRRPAAARPGGNSPACRDRVAPAAPRRPRAPRQAIAAAAVLPTRTGWLARCFGRGGSEPAPTGRPSFPDLDTHFTPESHPGLAPEMCAILNTPVEDCDPEILRVVFTAFAELIADALPPELRGLDGGELFSTLAGRLGSARGEARQDAAPELPPEPAPETAVAAMPDAPPQTMAARPAERGTAGAADAPISSAATSDLAPDAPLHSGPAIHAGRTSRHRGRSLRPRHIWRARRDCLWPFRCRRLRLCRGWRNPLTPPLRRLCYAACAGPP